MKRFLLLATLVALPALAAELEGVKVPDSVTVDGKSLTLNGQGLRRKFIFNVYVASLYLEHPSQDANAVIAADEIKRVELKLLRDVDRKTFVEAIEAGFKKNAKNFDALKERLEKFTAKIDDQKKGNNVVVQYIPGKGTRVGDGTDSYAAEGKDFADALFSVWLGAEPVDGGLKKGMLGQK